MTIDDYANDPFTGVLVIQMAHGPNSRISASTFVVVLIAANYCYLFVFLHMVGVLITTP